MTKHYKFPKIGQFNQAVRNVKSAHDFKGVDDDGKAIYVHDSDYPTVKYIGTTKLHGTNSAVFRHEDGAIVYQSRERIITPESDNAGFATWFSYLDDNIKDILLPETSGEFRAVGVFGEWCGGNIQKGVAISGLPKMFVIFGIVFIDEPHTEHEDHHKYWNMDHHEFMDYFGEDNIQTLNDNNIHLITQFPTYEVDVDFNKPEEASVKFSEITEAIEKECPVGKAFGVSGIGEGAVWRPVGGEYTWFKVKGKKHSSSKVKTLAPVDIEKVKTVNEFVEKVVTDSRLEQGINYLKEMEIPIDIKSTGKYIKWVVNDIRTEEAETMKESGLEMKDVGSALQAAIKPFWFKYVNTMEY